MSRSSIEYSNPYQTTTKIGQAGFLKVTFFGSSALARTSKPNAVASPTATNAKYPMPVDRRVSAGATQSP